MDNVIDDVLKILCIDVMPGVDHTESRLLQGPADTAGGFSDPAVGNQTGPANPVLRKVLCHTVNVCAAGGLNDSVPNFRVGDVLDFCREQVNAPFDAVQAVEDRTVDRTLEPGHTAEAPRLRRLKYPELLHPAYDHVFRHESIIDIAAQLLGPNIRHHGGKLNMKSAGFGSPVEWHQDFAFAARTNDDMLAGGVGNGYRNRGEFKAPDLSEAMGNGF